MSLRSFEVGIDRFINADVPAEVGKLQRVIATAGLAKVNLKSPVKTGRFRGGWLVTVGESNFTNTTRLDPSGSISLNEGLGVIEGVAPFSTVYIQNNIEYAEALEDGGSKQAPGPGGILMITMAELEVKFK